jgi:hypothetical protein
MSSILIYFQSLIQSEASDMQLATRSSQNSRPRRNVQSNFPLFDAHSEEDLKKANLRFDEY